MRPAFEALWNLDLAFADVVATSTDPNLGVIRLAWWRERLEQMDEGVTPPAEPRLEAVAVELLRRGVTGTELSQLEDAWLPLLQACPWDEAQAEGLRFRGRILFGIGARLLGGEVGEAERAGELWSLLDGARHCSDPGSREFLLGEARTRASTLRRAPARIRPLSMLAAVALHDMLGRGAGRRGLTALGHRYRGTYPR